jgi:hypothetical protein
MTLWSELNGQLIENFHMILKVVVYKDRNCFDISINYLYTIDYNFHVFYSKSASIVGDHKA